MAETIISGPGKIYLGTVDLKPGSTAVSSLVTARTSLQGLLATGVPANPWALYANADWDDGGITITADVEMTEERVDGSPYIRDAFINTAGLMVSGAAKYVKEDAIAVLHQGNTVNNDGPASGKIGMKSVLADVSNEGARLKATALSVLVIFPTPHAVTNQAKGAALWLPRAFQRSGLTLPLARGQGSVTQFEFAAMDGGVIPVGLFAFKDADATA